jgi:tetratricopeptide (TPR) repeat protein
VRTLTPDERRRLESLGYVSLGKRTAEGGPLPDPKDRIVGWTAFNRGMALRQTGRLAEAETALHEALAQAPALTGPILELGEIYFAARKTSSLMSLFEEAVRTHSQSGELRIRFAYYLVLSGKTAAALDELQAADKVVAFGEREQYYDTLGMAYGSAGDFARAVEAYGKVLEIEPDNADAARKRGYALFRLGRFDEALAAFRQAEVLTPDNPLLLEEMGRFFAAQKDYGRAESYFKKAVERPDPPALALFNYAVLLSEKSDFSRAIELMERYLALPGQDSNSTQRARQLLAAWRRR